MDPVFAVVWCTLALLGGFSLSYILLGWHRGAAVAVLASFIAIGVGLMVPGGVAAGLVFLIPLVSVGIDVDDGTVAFSALFATALAVTTYANASHTPDGAIALLALFTAVGTGWGADARRRILGLAVYE